jgi:hypothetical protein
MEVLNFRSNAELVQFAVKNNIVTTPDAMSINKIPAQSAVPAALGQATRTS